MRRLVIVLTFLSATTASAQEELIGEYASFWDIELGAHALELNPALFADYACGTNGGPPSRLIGGWADYATCPAEEETGLHEVQFRYDDEPEYWARAWDLRHLIATYEGTKISTISVIVSALFDADGFLVGLRAATDTRVDEQERLRSIALGAFLLARFGIDQWDCVDLPEVEGETPIGTRYQKERCTQMTDTLDLAVGVPLLSQALGSSGSTRATTRRPRTCSRAAYGSKCSSPSRSRIPKRDSRRSLPIRVN